MNTHFRRIVVSGIFAALMLTFFSCGKADPNEQIDEGAVEGETYTSSEIGWTMRIPEGWEIISRDQQETSFERGIKAVEEVAGEIDYSGLKQLISFQKNQFNIFQSSSEPFPLEYEGAWEDNHEYLKEVLYDTYTNQGIKVDTASSKAMVDGIDFEVFHIVVHGRKGEVILYQDMYSGYINGFAFTATLNYNNEADKEILMKVWKESRFRDAEQGAETSSSTDSVFVFTRFLDYDAQSKTFGDVDEPSVYDFWKESRENAIQIYRVAAGMESIPPAQRMIFASYLSDVEVDQPVRDILAGIKDENEMKDVFYIMDSYGLSFKTFGISEETLKKRCPNLEYN